ncbi:hypothetical protein BDQ12DRAFT_722471 [Crucibulum laeve]|uniref:Uncharacterized protein n=1 Tax=Crucibulum laeve TaxID=68775 RepID=A0A5C3M4I3_9AGAR|nr:hypothetical protein BDQ12DRAFT_722471 [Crucibulum laeve]
MVAISSYFQFALVAMLATGTLAASTGAEARSTTGLEERTFFPFIFKGVNGCYDGYCRKSCGLPIFKKWCFLKDPLNNYPGNGNDHHDDDHHHDVQDHDGHQHVKYSLNKFNDGRVQCKYNNDCDFSWGCANQCGY